MSLCVSVCLCVSLCVSVCLCVSLCVQEYDPSQPQAQDSGESKEADTDREEQAVEGLGVKGRRSKEKFVPASLDYHAKYKHILGTETGLEAARKAVPNQKFGMGMW